MKKIKETKKRENIHAEFKSGEVFEAPIGTTAEEFARHFTENKFEALAILSDGVLHELTYVPKTDLKIETLDITTSEGIRIYRRSLAFMFVTAVEELFPDAEVFIDYTVPFGGYFCKLANKKNFSADELKKIEAQMKKIVEENNPIRRVPVPVDDAKEIFKSRNEFDKLQLVDRRGKETFMMYQLRNRKDAFYGYMVPSTGYLSCFALVSWKNGFVLQYPRRSQNNCLLKTYESPMLTSVFNEYGKWLRVLGVENISCINELTKQNRTKETILVSEALQEQRIAQIAGEIADKKDSVRLVLIAGPSSSGKTTFSKRLAIQLLAHGIKPYTLEMDRYFVERDKTPRDENGEYNFETIDALDLELLNKNLNDLMEGKEVVLPEFDFISGKRKEGPKAKLDANHIIIAEGIHGLNPKLVSNIKSESIFRIYISALTQLNIDRHNRVSTTDTRLIRRIVRDVSNRGADADKTLSMWEKVRAGEKVYIFPFQENADVMFNSALAYEMAVLKPLAAPLLHRVKHTSQNNATAKRLLALLNLIDTIPSDMVPENSIIREFVGGSILKDYLPGKIVD